MAFGIIGTHIVLETWIDTPLIDARFVIRTIGIGFAFGTRRLHWFVSRQTALNVRRSKVVGWTRTDRLMVDGIAYGINAACVDARVGALLIEACAIGRTVIVCDAFGVRTNGDGIHDATIAIRIAR